MNNYKIKASFVSPEETMPLTPATLLGAKILVASGEAETSNFNSMN